MEFLDAGIQLMSTEDPESFTFSQVLTDLQDEILAKEVDEHGGPGSDNMSGILI